MAAKSAYSSTISALRLGALESIPYELSAKHLAHDIRRTSEQRSNSLVAQSYPGRQFVSERPFDSGVEREHGIAGGLE